ncbi:restriction endonuclease subunit S [Lacticaseibacillus paracasei]|uniref:restriction endonuclease subunit S n=1 Tax=Lacticaseibacillus paracasei TaxID=1597 RepID=UPI0021C4B922|nr:restriction endonuclease subunit S [Lacticaseibacillus paracasei]MCP9305983.1 restriction endonuclease subunit S [Lacticaseibacillus paracasei]MCP9311521.1 restriction endonuclease subunit S [Lacticaseibacillus paracasei]MCP9367813.1 restriction endonuclease subunit S [Lacticaseibacillus paracasei]MCP9380088.1 restriction endonuclease subunit S [Lacticaseibacillus paracasei]
MITEQHVPQFRFKDFSDSWEQRRLGDVAQSFEYGLNAAALEYDGENKYLRITDIDDETHEFKTDALTTPDVDLAKADNYRLQDGDVLFARTGASVGKAYRYKASDGLVYFAGFLIRARIKPEYDTEFIFQSTLTDSYNRYVSITSQRSGQPGVNAQEYAEFELSVPKIDEQRQIGQLFKQLDRLLTLHQRKLELLKRLKQGYLQKLFPQNGENVPELRFKGYYDAWEQRRLSNYITITGGNAWKSSDYSIDGDYLVVTISNVQGQRNINDKIGNKISVADPGKYLLRREDILVSLTGNVGRVSRMTDIPAVLNQRVGLIKPKTKRIDDEFLFQVLSNRRFESSMVASGQGAAQANISNNDVLSYKLLVPQDVREQSTIAHFFRNFDNTIALHQRKLEKLQELKKGYLQKMFC